jgi:hypothetical protein
VVSDHRSPFRWLTRAVYAHTASVRNQIDALTRAQRKAVAYLVERFGLRRVADAAQVDVSSIRRAADGDLIRRNTARLLVAWLDELAAAEAKSELRGE